MYDLSGLDSGYYQKSGMGIGSYVKDLKNEVMDSSIAIKIFLVVAVVAIVLLILAFAGVPLLPRWAAKEGLTTPSSFIGRGGMERDDYGSPDISRTEAVRVVPGADCGTGICSIDDEYCRMYNSNLATPGSAPGGERFSSYEPSGSYPALREGFDVAPLNNDLAMVNAMRGA
jgi:hypothetical protein